MSCLAYLGGGAGATDLMGENGSVDRFEGMEYFEGTSHTSHTTFPPAVLRRDDETLTGAGAPASGRV